METGRGRVALFNDLAAEVAFSEYFTVLSLQSRCTVKVKYFCKPFMSLLFKVND